MQIGNPKYFLKFEDKLFDKLKKSKDRLYIFDYDGTLVPFAPTPKEAIPTAEVLTLLKQLSSQKENTIAIISGRDKKTLQDWFGHLPITLIAEHGQIMRERFDSVWKISLRINSERKKLILPYLDQFAKKVKGSFIEEKEFSLVWHYRLVDEKLGEKKALELIDLIIKLPQNEDLFILPGAKVVEIKFSQITKGNAVQKILAENKYDFILAVGDDVADEDIFSVLPQSAFSIKIGKSLTSAHYYLNSPDELINFIRRFLVIAKK